MTAEQSAAGSVRPRPGAGRCRKPAGVFA